MFRWACLAASAVLLLSAENPGRAYSPAPGPGEDVPAPAAGVLPHASPAAQQAQAPAAEQPAAGWPSGPSSKHSHSRSAKGSNWLAEDSRLAILRQVDGEFALANMSLPGASKGFRIRAGQPVDRAALQKALISSGPAMNKGDKVQITRLDFVPEGILVDLNGGGKVHFRLRDHLQGGVGFPGQVSQTTTSDDTSFVQAPKTGATIRLYFNPTPASLTADQLKQYLAEVLDFAQRSAALQWVETLPQPIREAIRDKKPLVGMDREEVATAMGRPDRKIREKNAEGQDIEDWIYGHPPAQTIFVRFQGEKVSQIDQYP
jgi:hypothetical protein